MTASSTSRTYWSSEVDPSFVRTHSVNAGTAEFERVATAFHASIPRSSGRGSGRFARGSGSDGTDGATIVSVKRVENLAAWMCYVSKRDALMARTTKETGMSEIEWCER